MKKLYSSFIKQKQLLTLICSSIMISLFLSPLITNAQLIVTTPVVASDVVSKLLGCNSVASNITLSSCGTAVGYFNGVNTNLGIDSGILFSSGNANFAVGPNNSCCQGTDNGCAGNAALTALCGQPTFNAAILDFDVVLNVDTLRFNYVFGSDEYSEWVGTSFNDVFALWLSGPGIIGSVNLATIPGGSLPVTISNVNCTIGNGNYYVCNDPANFLCNGSYNCPTSQGATTIQYDGLTKVMEAKHVVTPGQTYHLEFAISDAGDGIYDSGIFIEAGFLKQYSLNVLSDSTNFINPFDSALTIVEGCTPGVLHFEINEQHSDTINVPIVIGGSATNGLDYTQLSDTIIFLPFDTTVDVFVSAFADGLTEGNETIIIYNIEPCSGIVTDSFIVNIIDDFPYNVSNDTTICENGNADLIATYSPYYTYDWEPANMVACSTCSSTTGTTDFTTQFTVTVGLGTCTTSKSINVAVDVITPNAGLDQELCHGDTTQIIGTGGTAYQWTPATGLSDPNIANPLAFPQVTTDYILQAQGTYAACFDYDTVRINVVPNLLGFAGDDVTVCPGTAVALWAAGGDYYSWSPSQTLNDTTSASPIATPYVSTTYQVVITNIYNCVDTVTVNIGVFPDPVITLNQSYVIYEGETAQLFAHGGVGSTYKWTPDTYLSNPNIYNPFAAPKEDMGYTVVITTAEGCVFYDTTSVQIIHSTQISFPNAFTPNSDGVNDEFSYIIHGPFDLDGFKIFDRWGNPIFLSTILNEGWNGRIEGKMAEIGTYVYLMEGKDGDGNNVTRKGFFTLLR